MGTSIFGADGPTGYALHSYSLEAGTMVDLEQSIEVPGGTSVFALEGSGEVFVGSGESPVLQKLEVGPDGSFTPLGELSFGAFGVANTWFRQEHVQIVSPTKGYVFDGPNARIFVWNPRELTLEETIPLDELLIDDWTGDFGYLAFRREGELLLTFNWRDPDFYAVRDETALVVIDTETDDVTIERRAGCGEMTLGAEAADGTIYFSSGVHGASVFRTEGTAQGPEPCLLRVLPGERRFDPDFERALDTLTGDRPTGDLVPAGDGAGLLRVFHESEVEIPADASAFDLRGLGGWRWWRVDLDSLETEELVDSPFGAANTLSFRVGDAAYLLRLAPDFSASTILEASASEAPRPGIVVPGVVQSLVRVH
jgi:hypothetical protein